MNQKILLIGAGAAGNKAAIAAVKEGSVDTNDVLLVNSYLKDIPAEYRNAAIIVEGILKDESSKDGSAQEGGGFGKERNRAREAMDDALCEEGPDDIGTVIRGKISSGKYRNVTIVTSVSGGTGSGFATSLAEYISTETKVPTRIIGIDGFRKDPKDLKNLVDFSKDIPEGIIVNLISNIAFLKDCKGLEIPAMEAANKHIAKMISVLSGQVIKDSDNNIDPTDLFKAANTPGYQIVEIKKLDSEINSEEDWDALIKSMVDKSKSFKTTPSQTKFAKVVSMAKANQQYCSSTKYIKELLGYCFETFEHFQDEPEQFVAIISSGAKMPIEAIESAYEEFMQTTAKVDKEKDSFYTSVSSLDTSEDEELFGIGLAIPTKNASSWKKKMEAKKKAGTSETSKDMGDY